MRLLGDRMPEHSRVSKAWAGTPLEYEARISRLLLQRQKRDEIRIDEEFADDEPATGL